ncbi:MAG: DUF362 domain-containing protein [Candidatus Omnitrophica bacterium]|jgi:hypothetical protein|nr:DUF362 domain-containing protein [Candidatus Omnitrophota bacterium]
MEKSKVYFVSVLDKQEKRDILAKFNRLLKASAVLDFIRSGAKVALKLHFGEEGNTGFVKPEYVRAVSDMIKEKKALPVAVDTNTLYCGRRVKSEEHLLLAREHGFFLENIHAPVEIGCDKSTEVVINKKYVKEAKISSFFNDVDALVDIAHFKGHIMTGFGGALKNIGMGCASREGKLAQHSDLCPVVHKDSCIVCGHCVDVCPVKAISLNKDSAVIDQKLCIGCASCIAVCPKKAIDVKWESGSSTIQEKMVEYAFALLKGMSKPACFINFALKITKECDCLAKDDPSICPDVGIFASSDPVAIDKACFDSVLKKSGEDVFKKAHPERDALRQLEYAQKLGLGSLDYELAEIK